MKKKLMAVALVLIAATASANGEFVSGNAWLASMTSEGEVNIAIATGYAMGVHDTVQNATSCTPKTFTVEQLVEMTIKEMVINPEIRHHNADGIIVRMLKRVFPCEAELAEPADPDAVY